MYVLHISPWSFKWGDQPHVRLEVEPHADLRKEADAVSRNFQEMWNFFVNITIFYANHQVFIRGNCQTQFQSNTS